MWRSKRVFRLASTGIALFMFIPAMAPAAEAAAFALLSPQDGQRVSGRNVEIAVGYNTESNVKVTKLELWIDGCNLATKSLLQPASRGVVSFWWDTSKASLGVHSIAVKIYAGSQLVGVARGSASVGQGGYDLRPPAVRFANLKAGQVLTGKTSLRIVASDDAGTAPMISLTIDNALKLLSNTRPCVYDLDTTQYSDGEHELRAVAYDSSGNKSDEVVLKVVFKNGVERPVAAAPEVAQPRFAPASEEDYTPQIPAVQAAAPPSISSSATRVQPSKTLSAPAAAAAKPIAKPKAPRIPLQPQSSPKRAVAPAPVPAPIVIAKAPEPMPTPVALPVIKTQPQPVVKTQVAPEPKPGSVEQQIVEPRPAPAPAVTAPEPPTPPKPIKIAMLLTSQLTKPHMRPVLEMPKPIQKDTKAKLEKTSAPASGKVKLRDLFDSIGGVVFWDAASKTVIAYGPGVKMELKIGSPVVVVNGKPVKCTSPPMLVNGRTIIDAGVYHQAVQLAAPPLTISALF